MKQHFLGLKIQLIGGHYICPALIPKNATIVDIGANVGKFAKVAREIFDANLYAVEPTPSLFDKLPVGTKIQKINAAVSNKNGQACFYIHGNCEESSLFLEKSSHIREAMNVETITLPTLLERFKLYQVDTLKIDAEGAELVIFDGCSNEKLENINQICVEFHEWMGIGTRMDVQRVINKIESSGFHSFSLIRGNYQAVLFVNRRLMSVWQYWCTWLRVWVPRVVDYACRQIPGKRIS
jgi:FkbM family methyltransferase